MLGRRFQDAASEDMGEQLVACLLEGGGGRNFSRFRTLFRHARRAPLFRSGGRVRTAPQCNSGPSATQRRDAVAGLAARWGDRKSTRLNSSHSQISYAVFCLKKKKTRGSCPR